MPLGSAWHARPCSLRAGAGDTGDRLVVTEVQDTHGPEEIGLGLGFLGLLRGSDFVGRTCRIVPCHISLLGLP